MSPTVVTLASLVPGLACCLAAAIIVLLGAPPRAKALGVAGTLMMVAAQVAQLILNLSSHDGLGWLWVVQAVSLVSVAGLVMLAVAAITSRQTG